MLITLLNDYSRKAIWLEYINPDNYHFLKELTKMDLDQIEKNYDNFNDLKIESIAKNDVPTLDPKVILILINEIKKRGLNPNLIKGIAAQSILHSPEKIQEAIDKIKTLPCPECGSLKGELRGAYTRTVMGFIIVSTSTTRPIICCDSCISGKKRKATVRTLILGWWGFPSMLQTPYSFMQSFIESRNKASVSKEVISDFVDAHIGEIRTNWDEPKELSTFIHFKNTQIDF